MKDVSQQAEFYRQLGESIRKGRKRRQLSQDALAKLVGLTRTSLTNIENGRQHPPLHTFCEIVDQLKGELHEFLPRSLPETDSSHVRAMAGPQVRDKNELAFIETGIGIRKERSHGSKKTKNRSPGTDAS